MSFTYNVGIAAFLGSSLLRKLNVGHHDAVPAEPARWRYNDGKVMQGLVNRRAAEAGLWARGEFVCSHAVAADRPRRPTTIDTRVSDPGGLSGIDVAAANRETAPTEPLSDLPDRSHG